jgi:integrase
MASIWYYLDTRRRKADGTFPLKIKIGLNAKDGCLINLKISLREDQWENGEVVRHPNRRFLNTYVKQRYLDITNSIFKLEITGAINRMSPVEIKKYVESSLGTVADEAYTFSEHFERFISTREKESTKDIYHQTLLKIELFSPGKLAFSDINIIWLKGFEQFLKGQGLSVNSINLHIRNIRAVFNDAINEDKAEQNLYPFRKFKLKSEETRKRSLTIDQLRAIRDWPCEPHEQQYIDIFMLMFYLRGINMIDLAGLTKIDNGRVEFRRAKTGRLYSIKIEPEAEAIINKYRGKNFLLNINERYSNYKNYLHRMNRNLKEFGYTRVGKRGKKDKEGAFPFLSTYYTRHTWATLAAYLEIPKETIAAALGHGKKDVTDIYIFFDQNKIDEANRRVIDYLNQN